jgi:tripartite-type tricarboxylate transporter receptor subunit TctC
MDTTVKVAFAFLIAAGSFVAAGPTAAQVYPSQPIKLIVPFGAGGPPDLVARIIAHKLTPGLGRQVIVDKGRNGAAEGFTVDLQFTPMYLRFQEM